MKVLSEMPARIFRFEDYEDPTPNSPLMDMALDVVEIMSKSGLTTIPIEPTDSMIAAGMEVSGVTAEQARTIFKAMLAASGGRRGTVGFHQLIPTPETRINPPLRSGVGPCPTRVNSPVCIRCATYIKYGKFRHAGASMSGSRGPTYR
jgi:hypothetical protein